MIEIDDAGAGSFYGGIVIFITDGSNDYWEEINVKFFHNLNTKRRNKEIATEAGKITERGFRKLNIKRTDTIKVCPGAYLKGVRDYLVRENFKFSQNKIKGRTQNEVESTFKNLLITNYNIQEYHPDNPAIINSYQKSILEQRRDFHNVKQFWKPVKELMQKPLDNPQN